jgi:phosphoribosyl 1,2-cyclic phosphodiesterase
MSLRFTVLASGSAGNATLVEGDGLGLLIDCGLGPRQLAERLGAVDLSWSVLRAVVLTHTHGDHWNDRTLAHLHKRGLPLYCHPHHHPILSAYGKSFAPMLKAGLVRSFPVGEVFRPLPGLFCRAFPVPHDSSATFAFRISGLPDLFDQAPALAYASDLGCWDDQLAQHFADVDLLAVEFNHDEGLERASGRSARLIARVLGDQGHLSNWQAAGLLQAVLARTPPGRLQHLVQLHLSEDCNHPTLAREAAQSVLPEQTSVKIHTAEQHRPGATLQLSIAPGRSPARPRKRTRRAAVPLTPPTLVQGWLPGLKLA